MNGYPYIIQYQLLKIEYTNLKENRKGFMIEFGGRKDSGEMMQLRDLKNKRKKVQEEEI